MCCQWGLILLFASAALAANKPSKDSPGAEPSLPRPTSDSSQAQEKPSTFGRLRQLYSGSSVGRSLSASVGRSRSLFEGLGRSLSGSIGRSLSESLGRSLSIVPLFGETHSHTSKLDTIELAEYYGYGAERHSVVTEDGYVLEVHRIYSGQGGTGTESKPVVVIQHGFLMDSMAFVVLGPKKALGYFLADAGYDVWLSNFRGNTYSRKHTTLSPDSQEFWNFSYTEHGEFDLPAVIKYALEVSGRSKVHYIGHSMGTLSFLIMAAKRPAMLSKVQTYTALAPITTATDGRAYLLQMLMKNYKTIAAGFEQAGVHELLSKTQRVAGIPVCSDNWHSKIICSSILFSFSGDNPHFDKSILGDILYHVPSGSSVKTFRHFGQNYFNGFREYDYGIEENIEKYNSEEPPIFDYSNMQVPSLLYFGIKDLMADPKGAIETCKILPKAFRCEVVDDTEFGHGDFLWATNAPLLVYERVLQGMQRFEQDNSL